MNTVVREKGYTATLGVSRCVSVPLIEDIAYIYEYKRWLRTSRSAQHTQLRALSKSFGFYCFFTLPLTHMSIVPRRLAKSVLWFSAKPPPGLCEFPTMAVLS